MNKAHLQILTNHAAARRIAFHAHFARFLNQSFRKITFKVLKTTSATFAKAEIITDRNSRRVQVLTEQLPAEALGTELT